MGRGSSLFIALLAGALSVTACAHGFEVECDGLVVVNYPGWPPVMVAVHIRSGSVSRVVVLGKWSAPRHLTFGHQQVSLSYTWNAQALTAYEPFLERFSTFPLRSPSSLSPVTSSAATDGVVNVSPYVASWKDDTNTWTTTTRHKETYNGKPAIVVEQHRARPLLIDPAHIAEMRVLWFDASDKRLLRQRLLSNDGKTVAEITYSDYVSTPNGAPPIPLTETVIFFPGAVPLSLPSKGSAVPLEALLPVDKRTITRRYIPDNGIRLLERVVVLSERGDLLFSAELFNHAVKSR